MTFQLRRVTGILILLLCLGQAHAQLTTTIQNNASALTQMLTGNGVAVSNVVLSSYTQGGSGTFRNLNGLSQIGLDSGIVLSTGRVTSMPGLQSSANVSFDQARGGDNQLSALLNGTTTFDAQFLEFDFIPTGDTIQFDYVFASEEYPEFNCSNYNDVFAFFISGPGIVGTQNIALVPGTTIPVAINSINSGVPGNPNNLGICTAMGAGSPFTQYYINNTGNQAFSYDGHTKVLRAKHAVTPCQTYHMKIAIADGYDGLYDSGVFLKAGSLTSDPVNMVCNMPLVGGVHYLVEGCASGSFNVLRPSKRITPQQVALTFSGTAANGTDVVTIPSLVTIPGLDSVVTVPVQTIVDNIPEGIETITVCAANVCANLPSLVSDCFTFQIRDVDTLNLLPNDTATVCGSQSLAVTATSSLSPFQWSPATGVANPNAGNTTITATSGTTKYYLTAGSGNCKAVDSLVVMVKKINIIDTIDVNCKGGSTGSITAAAGQGWGTGIQYSIDNGAFGNTSVFNNLPVGLYTIRIKDNSNCVDSAKVPVVQAYPDLATTIQTTTASCIGTNGSIAVTGSGGLAPYQYASSNNAFVTDSVLIVNDGKQYYTIKDANGCIRKDSATITRDQPISFTITPDVTACNGSTDGFLFIDATGGSGVYNYSLDSVTFQSSDTLHSFTISNTVYVTDPKGCSSKQNITIPFGTLVYVDAGKDTTICEGDSFQFAASSTADSFTWTPATSLSATNILNPTARPVTTIKYYVDVVKSICKARDSIIVTVNPAPIANAGRDTAFCLGKQIQLGGSGGVVYHWSPGTRVSDSTISNPLTAITTSTTLQLMVTDANGCTSLQPDAVRLTIVPALTPYAGRDTSVAMQQPLQLQGANLGTAPIISWSWSPSAGLSNPSISNPVLITDRDVKLVLTMATAEGCEGTDTVLVKAYKGPEIYVPDAFTPNGDGRNDLLRPIAVGVGTFKYFYVFNRWGQRVFAGTASNQGWDGRINGVLQPNGVYVWVVEMIDYLGQPIMKKGSTVLIR